jgi:hypothetical protein
VSLIIKNKGPPLQHLSQLNSGYRGGRSAMKEDLFGVAVL